MSASQQIELQTSGLLEVRGWGVEPSLIGSLGSQIIESARRLSLNTIFTRSVEERLIADGTLFQRFIAMERKRAARSGNSFMLVVLRVPSESPVKEDENVLAPLQRGIFSAVRNTDFVGWYEANQPSIGIVFTEIIDPNKAVASAILKRIRESISAYAAPGTIMKMEVTCQVFQGAETFDFRSIDACETAGD
jgi:hypothetical protein